jgi:lipopolysaccharide transport system ATP-binding protein
VLWLDQGRMQAIGEPHEVVRKYDVFLAKDAQKAVEPPAQAAVESTAAEPEVVATPGFARISRAKVSVDGHAGQELHLRPGESTLRIDIEFESDPTLPTPSAGVTIDLPLGMALTCAVARTDGIVLERDRHGRGTVSIEFPRVGLRKGEYTIGVYLGHENAIHVYDSALAIATLHVEDRLPEPGFVALPRHWHCRPGHGS